MARLGACKSAYLCPDHGSAFRDPPERLSKVAAAAHKRHLEVVLVDVMGVICRRQHLQQTVYEKKHAADSKLCVMTMRRSTNGLIAIGCSIEVHRKGVNHLLLWRESQCTSDSST